MESSLFTVLLILVLILANALFAAAEIALVSVRRSRIRQLADEGDQRAVQVEELHENAESLLATLQIGISFVGALAAAIGGYQLATPLAGLIRRLPSEALVRWAPQIALTLVVAIYTFVSVVVGELIPKSLALKYAEPLALRFSGLLLTLRSITRPLVWLLTASANLLLRPFKDQTRFTETRISAEELRFLVDEAAESGAIEEPRAEIIGRAVEFGELTVGDVLVPRAQVVALDKNTQLDEIRRVLLEEGHNRMPVYDGDLDTVIGYITAHDVISLIWERELVVLDDIIRPAFFVPETMRAVDLLRALQKRREHLAIVVDEYGGTAGICTTEDLVEEIVGDIFSEDSEETPLIVREGEGTALIQAILPVREFNRVFEAELPEDLDFDSVGGFVTHLAGQIPSKGETYDSHGFSFTIVERDERKVDTVRVRKHPETTEGSEERV